MTSSDTLSTAGWSAVSAAYATTLAPLCAGTFDAVLDAAGIGPGRRVLDVGSGTGGLAHAARLRGGDVCAVDPDEEMAAATGRLLGRDAVQVAGLPALPFEDGAFDAVLANFVVNHVPDPRAAARELARVTAPGGRVVVTIWPSGADARSRLWDDVLAAAGAVPVPGVGLAPDLDFPRTCAGLGDLLAGAGLVDVRSEHLAWVHRTYPDALWEGAAAGIGGIGRTVRVQSDEVWVRLREEYERAVSPLVQAGELVLPAEAVLAVGSVPSGAGPAGRGPASPGVDGTS